MSENALFYTFSTIAQTLAGAFGFLVAVVLYRMQSITAGMFDRTTDAGRYLKPNTAIDQAKLRGNWLQAVTLLEGTEPSWDAPASGHDENRGTLHSAPYHHPFYKASHAVSIPRAGIRLR